jgi:hypothetical protein
MNIKPELDEINNIFQDLSQKLLTNKSEQNQNWQSDISPLIAKAASFYGQTTGNAQSSIPDDENIACLKSLACICYAAKIGIKEAKKRNLNIKYWDKYPFPSVIQHITNIDLQVAAYKKLSVTKNRMSEEYLKSEIALTEDKTVYVAQFNWLLQLAGSPSRFLKIIYGIQEPKNMLQLHSCCIEFINEQVKKRVIYADGNLCELLINQITDTPQDIRANLQNLHYEFINTIYTVQSEIILCIEFLMYLSSVKTMAKENKKIEKLADGIARRYFDFIDVIKRINPDLVKIDYFIELSKSYALNINNFDSLSKLNPNKYSDFISKDQASNNSVTEIETAIIELTVSWGELKSQSVYTEQSGYINKKIQRLLASVNLEQYSSSEEIRPYDPTKQENVATSLTPPTKVRVLKPGYIQIRQNGTIRVLRKAIVESIDE